MENLIDTLYDSINNKLVPENEKGNVEYKLRLDLKEKSKKENMVAQILWRMNEGKNETGRHEAHYVLGVNDDGTFSDMTEKDLNQTAHIFRGIVNKANAKVALQKIYVFPNNKMIYYIMIKKKNHDKFVPEFNLMIMGPSDVGKSSMMSRLTFCQKDDGKGFARKLVLRHNHEKSTGVTSSIKYDTIGFNGDTMVNYGMGLEYSLEDIYNSSEKLINLIDLPGDMKYIKTILHSVCSINPDCILILIPLDDIGKLKEQETYYSLIRNITDLYKIQPIIVFTKSDISKKDVNVDELYSLTNSINFEKSSCVKVSNVTDEGYDDLISLIDVNTIQTKQVHNDSYKLFIINNVFKVYDAGLIFHGNMIYGSISVGEVVDVFCNNQIYKKEIKSIHKKTLDVEKLFSGESGCITFRNSAELDKTSSIINENVLMDMIKNKIIIFPYNCSNEDIKSQQYLFFTSNTITTVNVTRDEITKKFTLQGANDSKFLILPDQKFGMLKDEQQNIFFVIIE